MSRSLASRLSIATPSELPALVLAFAYFFCVLAAYYVIRPVRDQLSAAAGSVSLPFFYLATFIATLLLTPVFGALVARYPRKHFVPAVYAFFIVCLIAFVPLFQAQEAIGARTLGIVFFVWVSVFNLFVVSVFWSFMADIFDSSQARRLFATIAIGGTIGAVVGPLLATSLVGRIGVPPLLIVSASLLGVALLCMFGLIAWSKRFPVADDVRRNEATIGGSIFGGARLVLGSPFLRRMAFLLLLGDGLGTIIYALVADYGKAHYVTSEQRTAFYGYLDLATNTLTVLMQATLTRALLTRFGPIAGLIVPAMIDVVVLLAMAIFGDPMIVVALVVSRSLAYGVWKPSGDSLYTRVDREARYKSKNFIDTAVWRFGDLFLTTSFSLLKGLGVAVSGFALLLTGVAALSGYVGWRTAKSEDLEPEIAAKPSAPE